MESYLRDRLNNKSVKDSSSLIIDYTIKTIIGVMIFTLIVANLYSGLKLDNTDINIKVSDIRIEEANQAGQDIIVIPSDKWRFSRDNVISWSFFFASYFIVIAILIFTTSRAIKYYSKAFYNIKLKDNIDKLSKTLEKLYREEYYEEIHYNEGDELYRGFQVLEKMRKKIVSYQEQVKNLKEDMMDVSHNLKRYIYKCIDIQYRGIDKLQDNIKNCIIDVKQINETIYSVKDFMYEIKSYAESNEIIFKNDIVDIKREEVSIDKLIMDIKSLFKKLSSKYYIKYKLIDTIRINSCNIDRESYLLLLKLVAENAFCYAEKRVKIALGTEEGKLLAYIEDDGDGFTEEEIEHGKDVFYSGDYNFNINKGIGLYMADNLAKRQGGVIKLKNSPKGAVVKIEISI